MTVTESGILTIYSVQRAAIKVRLQFVFQAIVSKPTLLLTLPISVFLCLIILILRPVIHIRLGLLRSDRLGHFVMNHEIFLADETCAVNRERRSKFDIYFYGHIPVCNNQVALMWKRKLRVWSNPFLYPCSLIFRSSQIFRSHVCGEPPFLDRDVNLSLVRTSPSIDLLAREETIGRQTLSDMGIPLGASYVCLSVRDAAYTEQMGLGDLSYQSNRNADVNNYLMAANALAQRGIYVLRMGKIVLDDMKTSNPMIIDYAKSRFRSDFMDVFLAKNCLFSMGTNNGFLALPLLFRRPFLETDLPTLGWIYSYSESSLSLAKTLINCSSGEKMSLVEILKSPVAFSNRNHVFSNNGIQVVDNTPEQITAVTMEMLNRVHNINQYSSTDRFLQDRFRDLYLSAISEPSKVIHRNFRGSYSIDALRNDSHFLK